jgi:hypothetical protein
LSPSPLLCTPEQKPKLEARNGVDQIGYIDYLVRTLQAVDLRESHIQEFHAIAINEMKRNTYVQALKAADAAELKIGQPDLTAMRDIVEDALLRQLATVVDSLGRPPRLP